MQILGLFAPLLLFLSRQLSSIASYHLLIATPADDSHDFLLGATRPSKAVGGQVF
jgi:hypothetical protein